MIPFFSLKNKADDSDENFRELSEKLSSFSNFKIFTHKNPDGDALGSVLALGRILELQNKKAEIFVFDSFDRHFNFFPFINKIKVRKDLKDIKNDGSLFIYLDCSSLSRTGFDAAPFAETEYMVIDHHLVGDLDRSGALKIVNPNASSTAEIIFDISEKLEWKIDHDISFCLLAGILADTGTFQHSNTSPKTLQKVSSLVKNGVNLKKISDNLFKRKEVEGPLKIWGKILARIAIDEDIKMAYSFISQDDLKKYNTNEDELSGLVNLLSGIPESNFSLLLVENKFGKIKASMRSESYKGIDVAKIAKAFGGGGHKLAAGFEVSGKIEEEIESIRRVIEEEMSKSRMSEVV